MEKAASLQRANQQQRLVEWSRRVEACRSSGLPVGQWCRENRIAVSTYFFWQRKVFQALKELQEVTFAEVPVIERTQPSGHIVAAMEVSGVRIQVYGGADIWRTAGWSSPTTVPSAALSHSSWAGRTGSFPTPPPAPSPAL